MIKWIKSVFSNPRPVLPMCPNCQKKIQVNGTIDLYCPSCDTSFVAQTHIFDMLSFSDTTETTLTGQSYPGKPRQ